MYRAIVIYLSLNGGRIYDSGHRPKRKLRAGALAAIPAVQIESLALLVGFDRFMSECRVITNLIGNAVPTIVVSSWENEISPADPRGDSQR